MTPIARALLSIALLISLHTAAAAPASRRVDAARLSSITRELSSEAFQGRSPGTPGEARTIGYLVDRFRELGLDPAGDGGGWTQAVSLLRTRIAPGARVLVRSGAAETSWTQGTEIYLTTLRDADRVTLANAPLVFVGYGADAPERSWDDYKGVDLHGAVVVFLINDPDYAAASSEPVAGLFGGRAMTYYGRWTYKFAEAAKRGAVAALVIHDTDAAGYTWEGVVSPEGEDFAIRSPGQSASLAMQGWLEQKATRDLFHKVGLEFSELERSARRRDFKPIKLDGVTLTAELPVERSYVESHNVLAKLSGSKHASEAIVFGAHWDAFGLSEAADGSPQVLRAGAIDNALGVAGILELARLFSSAPKPERSLIFAAWTAEERGLLGSEAYVAHPTVPLSKTAASFTLDALQVAGPARDVILVGAGQTSLERDFAAAAAAQGRTVTPETKPEHGLFYRSDHFPFARNGVPVLVLFGLAGGADLVSGGRAAGDAWMEQYISRCYHLACDVWTPQWDLRGAAADIDLIYSIGAKLANNREWPTWSANSEFSAVRKQTDAQRK